MEEDTAKMGLRGKAESRMPGHCIIQAVAILEKFQQNTNIRHFLQAYPKEPFIQNYPGMTIPSLWFRVSVNEVHESKL